MSVYLLSASSADLILFPDRPSAGGEGLQPADSAVQRCPQGTSALGFVGPTKIVLFTSHFSMFLKKDTLGSRTNEDQIPAFTWTVRFTGS